MKYQMPDESFRGAVKALAQHDACSTKHFYLDALKKSFDQNTTDVLDIMSSSDERVEKNIHAAEIHNPQLKKCLKTLFEYSKGCHAKSQD